jgi:hypothetical protein
MHKFILGENPQSPDNGGLWIIHLPNPNAIIEAVIDGEKIHSKKAIFSKEYQYQTHDGIVEHWQLRLHHYFSTLFCDDKEAAILAFKMLDDAWQWYKSYLIFEDKNTYESQSN